MQHWELLCPGGLSFVCDDGLFQPSTDSFLLGSFPRLKPGLRGCDLGSGTGLLGLLLFQRQRALSVTGVELLLDAGGAGRRPERPGRPPDLPPGRPTKDPRPAARRWL